MKCPRHVDRFDAREDRGYNAAIANDAEPMGFIEIADGLVWTVCRASD
jgi:hypothetical protein